MFTVHGPRVVREGDEELKRREGREEGNRRQEGPVGRVDLDDTLVLSAVRESWKQ